MTTYMGSATTVITNSGGTGTTGTFYYALRAGSFEVKISRIEYQITGVQALGSTTPGGNFNAQVQRFATGTIAGGTAFTPAPLRQGAPAATATVRLGTATTVTGTSTYITNLVATGGGNQGAGGLQTYEFPYDFTVSPGGVFAIQSAWFVSGNAAMYLAVGAYFEELRLAWHY